MSFTSPTESPVNMEQSKELKETLMRQIQQETATANARLLIDAIQDNCFTKCVPKPGTSLSKGESQCYTQCVDKYMAAWNTVSATLLRRLREEGQVGS